MEKGYQETVSNGNSIRGCDMSKYRILLFDADNTLFDFDACEREALRLVFEKYGYSFDVEIYQIYEGINKKLWKQYELGELDRHAVIYTRFGRLFEQLGIADDGIQFEDDYQELLGMQHFFIKDAKEVIKALSKEYELYIVTNGVTQTQLRRLKDSGLDQYFLKIFVSEETGYQKPMKEFFDYCFERIKDFSLNETMIIGDSLSSDIQGGNNAKIATCWFNQGNELKNPAIKVDYEVKSLQELKELLYNLS